VPAPDYTDKYNTPLSLKEEQMFLNWATRAGKMKDLFDYDVRGAWKAGQVQQGEEHGTDLFKKPNHPTFSNESMYHSPETPGGQWGGDEKKGWTYTPSATNLQMHGSEGLKDYFKQVEPDVSLDFGENP
jgi:hypothetical protein